jgi:DUF1365 family protein
VTIAHRRRDPVEHRLRRQSQLWLVDLDALPRLPARWRWIASFDGRDHLGDSSRSLRANLDDFLAGHGVPPPARILMLASPRVLGYVFNPLSVFYCYDDRGRLSHTVAEVRNTYRGRHSYLLEPDADGRAEADKAFYVSPFYPVDGRYRLVLPEPGASLTTSVTLYRPGERPFAATVTGVRRPHAEGWLRPVLRRPWATRAVMFAIKGHGIVLYLKGLRPYPRPADSVDPIHPKVSETK